MTTGTLNLGNLFSMPICCCSRSLKDAHIPRLFLDLLCLAGLWAEPLALFRPSPLSPPRDTRGRGDASVLALLLPFLSQTSLCSSLRACLCPPIPTVLRFFLQSFSLGDVIHFCDFSHHSSQGHSELCV